MALTDRTFSKISAYGKTVKSIPVVGSVLRNTMNTSVNMLARAKGWHFPEKFPWDWRLEMMLGRYEKETTDLFKKIIRPGMTAVDIGAHIGYFTGLFSNLVGPEGRVIAFDADKENFSLLEENISWKRYQNVTLINKAVSDTNGTIEFYHFSSKTGSHSIIKPTAIAEKIIVPSVTLDMFLQDSDIANIDVVKIDIEGGEHYAFLGMKKLFEQKNPLYILSEFCPKHLRNAGMDPMQFLNTLREYGFQMYQVLPGGAFNPLVLEDVPNLPFYEMGYTNILFKKN